MITTKKLHLLSNRRSVVAKCHTRDKKGIFQARSDVPVSIRDAKDAYDCCHSHLGASNPSYNLFMVDSEMVEKYVHIVSDLEDNYLRSTPLLKLQIGPYILYITQTA